MSTSSQSSPIPSTQTAEDNRGTLAQNPPAKGAPDKPANNVAENLRKTPSRNTPSRNTPVKRVLDQAVKGSPVGKAAHDLPIVVDPVTPEEVQVGEEPVDEPDELTLTKTELAATKEKLRITTMQMRVEASRAKRKAVEDSPNSKRQRVDEEQNDEPEFPTTSVPFLDIGINDRNCYGVSPLILAASNGEAVAVNALLVIYEDIDVNAVNKHCSTALHLAAKHGHLEVVKQLLSHPDINPNRVNRQGNTPLNCAVVSGHLWVVHALLAHPRTNVNMGRKVPPLVHAATAGRADIAFALLNHGDADPNLGTPLRKSIEKGHPAVAKMLIGHKDIDLYKDGNPLVFAIVHNRLEIFRELLYHKSTYIEKPVCDAAKEHGCATILAEMRAFYLKE